MWDSSHHTKSTEGGEEQVPVCQRPLEIKWFSVLHEFLPEVTECQVQTNNDNWDLRMSLNKVKTWEGIIFLLEVGEERFRYWVILMDLVEKLVPRVEVWSHVSGGHL